MCRSCWENIYNFASLDTPDIRKLAGLIGQVYKYSLSGGHLHVVIDDWNLDDDNVNFALKYITSIEDQPGIDRRLIDLEWKCLFFLVNMTVEDRASALAMYEGFVRTE